MVFVDCLGIIVRHIPKIHFATPRKQVLDVLIELSLILFNRQEIVDVLLHNRLDNLGLAADGINRDDAARQFQHAQERRNGSNFVRFVLDFALSEHQMVRHRPRTHHRDCILAPRAVMRTTQLFTINGDNLTMHPFGDGTNPLEETLLKLLGIHAGKYSPKGIMRRNPVR